MLLPILHTKVILPQRKKDLLSRTRLLELVNELLDNKLVLVTAPAGYGKTSLIIDVACQHELPFCWYGLDPQDQDLIRFIAHFIASIHQKFPDFGAQSQAALQSMTQGSLSLEHLESLVIEEIYQAIHEHFVIVLDDYHLVADSQPVNTFVNRFVQDVGENCHILILSRSLLPLEDLPLMVARSQASGVGIKELAFRGEEIQALMRQNYQQVISSAAATDLYQKTEGWITGLLLSAQTMWQGMSNRIRTAEVTRVGLYDYLADQILSQQPPDLRDFLLRSSLLEEFDDQTCERILGQPPLGRTWQEMINLTLKLNLFVLPVGESGTRLRYHILFQEFLQNRISQELSVEKDRILRALGKEFQQAGEWAKAHALYQQLQDMDADAELLIRAGEDLTKSGRLPLLAKWLDELPMDSYYKHPFLLARRGMVVATLGNTDLGLSLLNQALSTLDESNRSHLVQTLLWRAMVHRMRGSFTESMEDSLASFSHASGEADLTALRAEALRIQGQNTRKLGNLQKAIEYSLESLAGFQSIQDQQGVARLSLELGAAYIDLGDYELALAYYHHALAIFEADNNFYALSSTLNDLGVLHYLRGEFQEASEKLENALTFAKKAGNIRVEALALTSLGDLYRALDSPLAALDAYREAREILVRIHDFALLAYLDLANNSIALRTGQLSQARSSLESAEMHIRQAGGSYTQGLYLFEAGHLALIEKKNQEAISFLVQARKIFKNSGQIIEEGRTCLMLARSYHEAGNVHAASTTLHEAFRIVTSLKNPHTLIITARETFAMLTALTKYPETKIEAAQLLSEVQRLERDISAMQGFLRRQKKSVLLDPPRLQIQALGIAQVTIIGRKLTSADWQTQITRELFFLLLSNHKGWTKEEIGEVLWPDSTPAQLKLRFKNTLYRLRRAFELDVVVFDGERYHFNWDLDYEYDVEQFRSLLEQVELSTVGIEKKQLLNKCIQLYQGEYLPEISTTWVIPEREHMNRSFINACLQFAEICLGEGDVESTLNLCQRVFAIDPYIEKAHRLAMLAYGAIGNRAAIVHQFHQLKHELEAGLNAKPSDETLELYHMLMR